MKPVYASPRTCPRSGFSLIEVVLAIGIFSFAIVAMLGLLGSSLDGVKKLADRDLLVAAGGQVAEKLTALKRSDLTNLPAGTAPAGRPTFYAYVDNVSLASDAFNPHSPLAWSTATPPPAAAVASGRVIRARVFRARESLSAEFPFDTTNISFPVRVELDLLAPGQENELPAYRWSFHTVLVPTE